MADKKKDRRSMFGGKKIKKEEALDEEQERQRRIKQLEDARRADRQAQSKHEISRTTTDASGSVSPRANKIELEEFEKIDFDALSALALADIKMFSLNSNGVLELGIVKALGLPPGKSGSVSAVCSCIVCPAACKDHEKKINPKKAEVITSSCAASNENPEWGDTLEIPVPSLNGTESKLLMELHDQENKGEFIGFVEVPLNNLGDTVQREEWFPLQRRKKKDRVNGEIMLRTRIMPEKRVEPTIVLRAEKFPTVPSFIYSGYWSEHCVKHVSITDCAITSLPEGFAKLSGLQSLILHSNQLMKLPGTIAKIFSLRILDIHNNKLKKLPTEMGRMKNLRELNIADNLFDRDTGVPDCIPVLQKTCNIVGKLDWWDEWLEEHVQEVEGGEGEPDEAEIAAAMERMKSLGMT
eukprot:TRINITY_DN10408_c0_g1_i1.p1 TRINITY_DN10408_c0_g1~~TRINITY_DN10408_c0_g1_i1.p1  ORF type:complete len:410 (+),score=137.89 TRINITY_DN10408_c0_g1_i1:89-1318(+)